MSLTDRLFPLTLACLLVLGLSSFSAPEESGRWTKRRFLDASPEGQFKALKLLARERVEIAGAITAMALLDKSDPERIHTIGMLAKVPSEHAIQFCLEHLSLKLRMGDITGVGCLLKERPCRFVLAEIGWQSIPYVLKYAEWGRRSDPQLKDVAWILRRVCEPPIALALATAWHEKSNSPEKQNLQKVITFVREWDKRRGRG